MDAIAQTTVLSNGRINGNVAQQTTQDKLSNLTAGNSPSFKLLQQWILLDFAEMTNHSN